MRGIEIAMGPLWIERARATALNLVKDPLGRTGRAALSRLGKSVRTDIVIVYHLDFRMWMKSIE